MMIPRCRCCDCGFFALLSTSVPSLSSTRMLVLLSCRVARTALDLLWWLVAGRNLDLILIVCRGTGEATSSCDSTVVSYCCYTCCLFVLFSWLILSLSSNFSVAL